MAFTVEPVTPDRWPELAEFFGPSGAYANCWCTWWRQSATDYSAGAQHHGRGNRELLHRLTTDRRVPGLLAYDERAPVGWVSVGSRPEFPRILRSRNLKPDPSDDPDDENVWCVPCFWIPRQHRGRGVGTALLDAAVVAARRGRARTLEGYPIDTGGEREPPAGLFTGTLEMFERAGFREVLRRSERRPVVRRELTSA